MGSVIVEWGRPAHLMLQIGSIWPYTGEDLVLRNNEGQIEGSCSGRKSAQSEHILQRITCWGNVEKGFIMESSDSCLDSCSIYIKVSLTEHSTSGTYYLELNETRCQFLNAQIYYRDFTPTCSAWLLLESNKMRFTCQWTTSVQDSKARLLSGNRTLNENVYIRIPGNQGYTLSTTIDLEEMFSNYKVPDTCVVSQSGFERNCTFRHVSQLVVDERMNTNIKLNCCIDEKPKPEIWYFTQSHTFIIDATDHQSFFRLSSPYNNENSMFKLFCGQKTTNGLLVNSIVTLILKDGFVTVSTTQASRNTSSDGSTCTHNYIITVEKEISRTDSTQSPPSSIPTSPTPSCPPSPCSHPISSPTIRRTQISSEAHTFTVMISVLVISTLSLLLIIGTCINTFRGKLLKSRYEYCSFSK